MALAWLDGIRSKIDTVRANRAQNAVEARQNAFTINEFGDVGIVDYNTLDKVDNNIKKEDIANLLKGNAVQVRTPNIPQRGPNPHDPRKVWKIYEPFTSFFANLFNVRTTGRANRLQHELELQLGRVAGNLVNMATHHAGGDHHLVGKEAQKAVDAMAAFVRQVEDFAKLYALDATNPKAVKDLIQKFATRLANSIKEDPTAVHQIYTMAKQWQVNKTELTQTDEVVMALRRALAPHEAKALATAAAAAAKPAPDAKPLSPEEQRRQERAALKRDLANQITAAKALCTKAGEEMRVFDKAIDEVTNELKNLDDAKGLSGANFRELVGKMDRTMQEIISKGRTIIDVTMTKKRQRLEEVREELAKEYGDISDIDLEQTNKTVKALLESNWETTDKLLVSLREVGTLDPAADAKLRNLKTSDANSTVNHMNLVIKEFSSARAKLNSLRNRIEKFEMEELIEKKAQTPPEDVDSTTWKEACHAVMKYAVSSTDVLKEMTPAHLLVLESHKETFLENLSPSFTRAYKNIVTHFAAIKGFVDITKEDALSLATTSFKACEQASTKWVSQLLNEVKTILDPIAPSPSDKKAAEVLKKYLDEAGFNLEDRIEEDVAETLDARQNGVFFEKDGKRCYLANSAFEILFYYLKKAVGSTQGSIINMNVANLVNVRGVAYTEAREKVVVELKAAMDPYVNAQRTMREVLLGNALTRIREGLPYIRSLSLTDTWEEDCDYIENLLTNVHKLDVEDVKDACTFMLEDIRKKISEFKKISDLDNSTDEKQRATLDSLTKVEAKLSEDVDRLSQYGVEEGLYGDKDLLDAIHLMDRLKLTYKRALDLQNLISNSLEVLPKHLNKLIVAENKHLLDSRIVSVGGSLRTLSDKLRTDYALYTQKVVEYAAFLREKNVNGVDEERHTRLVNDVRDALSVCTTSFMQMMHLVSEVEVFARDQFLYYDEVVVKSMIARQQAVENGDTTVPDIKETPKICTNELLAKILRDMRLAVQNGFCALSEIPRGLLLEQGAIAEQEGLPLLTMTAVDATYSELKMTVETKREHERGTISMIGDGAEGADVFEITHKMPTLLLSQKDQKAVDQARKVQRVRRIFSEGFGSQASLRQTMTRRGSRSAELFNATENATLARAAEKRRRATNTGVRLQEETIKAIQQLIDARIPITTETELFDYLTKTVMDELNVNKLLVKANEADVKRLLEPDFKMLDGGDASGLTQKLITLSSKWKAYGILRQGETVREYSAQEMSKHVKGEGYRVLWLNETRGGKTNRALLEDKKGNRLFYTLTAKKETEGKVKVAFIPEMNLDPNSKAAFKEFSVTMSKKTMGLAVEGEP